MSTKVKRQSIQNRIVHWGVAISIFGLILSGLFQLPLAKRYNINKVWEWSAEYFTGLEVHYFFAITLIFFALFHVIYHIAMKEFDIFPRLSDFKDSYLVIKAMIFKGEEPPSEKYLPEQRLAYIAIAFVIFMLILTGMIKTFKNIAPFDIPNQMYFISAQLHNLGMILIILLIIAHLGAFIPRINRNLLSGMFSGKIDAKYTLHRHSKWKDGINEAKKIESKAHKGDKNEQN